jgi:membrane dipeptidase
MDYYHQLVDEHDLYQLISTQADLDAVLATWAADAPFPRRRIGLVPLMEGGDPIREPEQFEEWYAWGIRIVGPAWMKTRYSGGSHEPAPLSSQGHHLLEVMGDLNAILDVSHMAEQALMQALDSYTGTLIASHSNPQRFCPSPRGLTDEQIALIAERGGVVGIVGYNRFLKPGWAPGDPKHDVPLHVMANAIDHVCQVTGDVAHVGIGSDFDGFLGAKNAPDGIDTVMDLQKLAAPLAEYGYTTEQIDAIFYKNWLRTLRKALPE